MIGERRIEGKGESGTLWEREWRGHLGDEVSILFSCIITRSLAIYETETEVRPNFEARILGSEPRVLVSSCLARSRVFIARLNSLYFFIIT